MCTEGRVHKKDGEADYEEITVAILTGGDEKAGEAAVRVEELSAQPRTVQLLTYLFIG